MGPDADFGFAGMYEHARSGLNWTMFRAYNSSLGRWLSRDPLGEQVGTNLYSYVGNDPVNVLDPLGVYDVIIQWAPAKLSSSLLGATVRGTNLGGCHGDLLVVDDAGEVAAGWGGQLRGSLWPKSANEWT